MREAELELEREQERELERVLVLEHRPMHSTTITARAATTMDTLPPNLHQRHKEQQQQEQEEQQHHHHHPHKWDPVEG